MSARRNRRRRGNPAANTQAQAAPPQKRTSAVRASRGPLARWVETFATEKIPAGVDYPHALRTTTANPFTSLLGVTVGLVSFMIFTPLLVEALARAYWLAVGSPGEFSTTRQALVSYELPFGLVVGHLGLASLIPISFALVLFVHRVRPGILSSVAIGLRWRWLALCLVIAFVSLWVVLAVQGLLGSGGTNFALNPQSGAVWFLLIMLVTTPLQAAAEEYFFRGYLMQSLGSMIISPWFGIVTSAAVFTLFHGSLDPALIVDRFAFGVLAGWLVVRTGGLEAGIAAHVANNVTSFGLAALTSSVAQVKAISEITWVAAGWDIARFAVFAALIVWLSRGVKPQTLTPAP